METIEKSFLVYKGLQMPLVLKGFKGRYIYWGLGILLSSFILATILVVSVNIVVGIIFMILYLGIGLFLLSRKQKEGMYTKRKQYGKFKPEHSFSLKPKID